MTRSSTALRTCCWKWHARQQHYLFVVENRFLKEFRTAPRTYLEYRTWYWEMSVAGFIFIRYTYWSIKCFHSRNTQEYKILRDHNIPTYRLNTGMYWLVMTCNPFFGNLLTKIESQYVPVFRPYAGNVLIRWNLVVLSILEW